MVRWARGEPVRRARRAQGQAGLGDFDDDPLHSGTPGSSRVGGEVGRRLDASRLERRSPTRSITLSFVVLILVGTTLLMIPGMRTGGGVTPMSVALFTSTSASCVTGLSVVDTATYWTPLGQVTILLLIQVGGFGIQALGTLWMLLLSRRMGATSRQAAQAETGAMTPGEVRKVLQALATITIVVEASVALFLTGRFWLSYDVSLPRAGWLGLFHSVSAFNNAGFALASDSLITYGSDPFVLIPIGAAIVLGGLGFLVILETFTRATSARGLVPRRRHRMSQEDVVRRGKELARRSRYRLGGLHPERLGFANPVPLSLHTRLMLTGTAVLIAVGSLGFMLFEWANPATLGHMPWWQRILNSVFSGGISPRTAGFNAVDYAQAKVESRFLVDGLMFTGGGSGSTAGGIKVTTLMVLLLAVLAEVRGHRDVNARDRRIPDSTVRIAIAVTMVSFAAVMLGTMALLWLSDLTLDLAMFEVISALATVGLSANVTPGLGEGAQLLLVLLMLLGRVGPLTLASSLTLRMTVRHYRLPEGRPMVG